MVRSFGAVVIKTYALTSREVVQITASLRYWGRAAETSETHPSEHPLCKDRFKRYPPMTNDEIESLIGRLDGTWDSLRPRPWNPTVHL